MEGGNEYLYVLAAVGAAPPYTFSCKRFDWDDLSAAPTDLTMSGFDTLTGGIMRLCYDAANGQYYIYQHSQTTGGTSLVRATKAATTITFQEEWDGYPSIPLVLLPCTTDQQVITWTDPTPPSSTASTWPASCRPPVTGAARRASTPPARSPTGTTGG